MFYRLCQPLTPCPPEERKDDDEGLLIWTGEEQELLPPSLRELPLPRQKHIHFCKEERVGECMVGTLAVPGGEGRHQQILFALSRTSLLLWGQTAGKYLERLSDDGGPGEATAGRVLCRLLVALIEGDAEMLERMEDKATALETAVLSGDGLKKFDHKMLACRKQVLNLSHYYLQLADMAAAMQGDSSGLLDEEDVRLLGLFTERVARLREETQLLRDYLMQIREVYQGQIGIRQNEIMKVLTIVTVVFLPLTLLVGWYGMNFSHMPELDWPWGYPAVILAALVVVIVLVIWFKKKKFW